MEIEELKFSLTEAVRLAAGRVLRAFEETGCHLDVTIDKELCNALVSRERLVVYYEYHSELYVAYYDADVNWKFSTPIRNIEDLFDKILIQKLKD